VRNKASVHPDPQKLALVPTPPWIDNLPSASCRALGRAPNDRTAAVDVVECDHVVVGDHRISGRMRSASPTLSRGLSAKRVASAAQKYGRISRRRKSRGQAAPKRPGTVLGLAGSMRSAWRLRAPHSALDRAGQDAGPHLRRWISPTLWPRVEFLALCLVQRVRP